MLDCAVPTHTALLSYQHTVSKGLLSCDGERKRVLVRDSWLRAYATLASDKNSLSSPAGNHLQKVER
jgi:hypothetical protein